jgi:hypothetical protein
MAVSQYSVTNHSEDDTTQPGYYVTRKFVDEYLGVVAVEMSSQCLLVTGYLRISVNIPEVKVDCRLDDVRLLLEQSWHLQSLREQNRTQDVPPLRIPLWSIHDSTSSEARGTSAASISAVPRAVKAGSGFFFEKRIIFPEDDRIRATTSPNSSTGLKACHQLSLQISYTPTSSSGFQDSRKPRVVRIAAPATMSMCACAVEALELPPYGETAEIQSLHQTACDQRAKACKPGPTANVTFSVRA